MRNEGFSIFEMVFREVSVLRLDGGLTRVLTV